MILSVVFAFVGNITGLVISYFLNIPSGATIIFTLVILFALLKVVKTVTRNIPVKL